MIWGHLRASPAWFSVVSARSSANQMINKWCEALSSISHVLGSRKAKSQKFRFSVISELYIEIWFLLSNPSLSGIHETLGVEYEHPFEYIFRKLTYRNAEYQIECCIFLGVQNFRFFMISRDLRASPASFSAISARSCAKQMINNMVRSILLHLSCSGVSSAGRFAFLAAL